MSQARTYRQIRLEQQAEESSGLWFRIKLGVIISVIIILVALAGCSGGGGQSPPASPTSPTTPTTPTPVSNADATTTGVAVVSVAGTDTTAAPLSLTVGSSPGQLHAVLLLSNGSFTPTASVTWATSSSTVASVSPSGEVTPNSPGSAQITASYLDQQGVWLVSPAVVVNVAAAPTSPTPTPTPPTPDPPTPTPPAPTPPTPAPAATSPLQAVIVGDSIVTAWCSPATLAQNPTWACQGSPTTAPEETTTEVLARFQTAVTLHPTYIVIEAGTWDLDSMANQEPGVQPCESTTNLCANIKSMISEAQAAGITVIVCTTLPWGAGPAAADNSDQHGEDISEFNLAVITDAEPQAAGGVAGVAGVTAVDMYALLAEPIEDYPNGQCDEDCDVFLPAYTSDGVNPSSAGGAVMTQAVQQAMAQAATDTPQQAMARWKKLVAAAQARVVAAEAKARQERGVK